MGRGIGLVGGDELHVLARLQETQLLGELLSESLAIAGRDGVHERVGRVVVSGEHLETSEVAYHAVQTQRGDAPSLERQLETIGLS